MSKVTKIYLANIPFEDQNKTKFRPALVMRVGGGKVKVFKITSKYKNKPVKIQKLYFPINHWREAGLKCQSYVDTHRTYTLSSREVFKNPPIGKLTAEDATDLFEFISRKH